MYWWNSVPSAAAVGIVAFIVLISTPGTVQQTADGVARIELCQPHRVLPSYMQDACDELLASRGTAQSAMADSGTGASPPDRRPLSDPPRYGRRSGGPPLNVHLSKHGGRSKRLYALPTFKLYNVMNRQQDGGRRASDERMLINQSANLLRRLASLRDQFTLLDDM